MDFKNVGLIAPILKAIDELAYTVPIAIQKQSIPRILVDKDIIGRSGNTGRVVFSVLKKKSSCYRKSKSW